MRPSSAPRSRLRRSNSNSQPLRQLKFKNQRSSASVTNLLSNLGPKLDLARKKQHKHRKKKTTTTTSKNIYNFDEVMHKRPLSRSRKRPSTAGSSRSPSKSTRPSAVHSKVPPLQKINATLRTNEIKHLAASRKLNTSFQSRCIRLEVEFNEEVRHLPVPRSIHNNLKIEAELDDVGTRSTRYAIFEKSFEKLVNTSEKDGTGIGRLLRRVKIEYDRQIAILTSAAYRRYHKRMNQKMFADDVGEAKKVNNATQGLAIAKEIRSAAGVPKVLKQNNTEVPECAIPGRDGKEEDQDAVAAAQKMERMRLQIDHQHRIINEMKMEQNNLLKQNDDKNEMIDELQRTTIQWRTWVQKGINENESRKKDNNENNGARSHGGVRRQHRHHAVTSTMTTIGISGAVVVENPEDNENRNGHQIEIEKENKEKKKLIEQEEEKKNQIEKTKDQFAHKKQDPEDEASNRRSSAIEWSKDMNEISDLKKEVSLLRAALLESQNYNLQEWEEDTENENESIISDRESSLVNPTNPTNPTNHTSTTPTTSITSTTHSTATVTTPTSASAPSSMLTRTPATPLTPTANNSNGFGSGRPPRSDQYGKSPLPSPAMPRLLENDDSDYVGHSQGGSNAPSLPHSLPLSRSNVMLMEIPEGDEAMLSPSERSSLGNRSLSFSMRENDGSGNYTGRSNVSIGGRSEMSEASAMSVSPRIMPDGGGSKWDEEIPEGVTVLDLKMS